MSKLEFYESFDFENTEEQKWYLRTWFAFRGVLRKFGVRQSEYGTEVLALSTRDFAVAVLSKYYEHTDEVEGLIIMYDYEKSKTLETKYRIRYPKYVTIEDGKQFLEMADRVLDWFDFITL